MSVRENKNCIIKVNPYFSKRLSEPFYNIIKSEEEPMGVRENKVEKYLDKKIQEVGGITRKWVSPGRDGVPDRIVIIPSTAADVISRLQSLPPEQPVADIIFVEVKTVDGLVSLSQNREQQRLIREGCNVKNVYGERGVNVFIERFVAWIKG